ncbi:hypothetical protein [Streptomyces sp. AK02-04a]|uniref:hypothetical protein n=1 Tax=Streptomyces sp. AK02-04a TaxID=3028649 RepID=UPI0029BF0248|nr:hypothetical protein [Streptomyces sp. AK02-04a]MDX3758528.1 hypothetical protein [Streptomyces sp. AK02-04a]
MLGDIRVPRLGRGRPRTTPAVLLADKACSSKRVHADVAARGMWRNKHAVDKRLRKVVGRANVA